MSAPRDLMALSESFPDMVRRYTGYVKTAGKEMAKKALPNEVPDDLQDQLFEALAHLADATVPNAAAKLDRIVTSFIEEYGERARRLKKAAEAAGVGVKESKLRLVNDGITFAEIAHNPWTWQGTIVEARIPASEIVLTPVGPKDCFVIYAPAGSRAPKRTPSFKILDSRTR
jgi:hypothetical protein